jgi:DNA-binding LacI/PurR family transcriptional regulator
MSVASMEPDVEVRKRKLGLREIAVAANVSVATVSRVLNGNNRVDKSIQKAVLNAAAKLDIDLTQRNKTKALAFLLGNREMLHAFHSRILTAAEAHCATLGWDMVFLSFAYPSQVFWKELYLPKVVQRHDVVRGVILAGTNSTNLLELLVRKDINFAVFGNNVIGDPSDLKNNDVVFSDDKQGGSEMTRYLIDLGHRNIGFVGNTRLPWFARCFEGYRQAMEEAGLEIRQSNTYSQDDTESGYLGAKSMLARDNSVTAILAGNDTTAHGVYKAVQDIGLKIPDDISVAGCDDTVGAWLQPGLTTTREFPEQLGKQLVELVVNRADKPGLPPQHVTIPTELVKRESCSRVSNAEESAPARNTKELSTP